MAVKFKLPEAAYQPGGLNILKAASVEDARAEYTRLRRVAQKRLKHMEGTEYEDSDIYIFRMKKRPFKPSSKLTDVRDLQAALSDVHGFLNSNRSSLRGLRALDQRSLNTLHDNGYTFVNKTNLKAFGDFMEAARMKAGGKLRSSDRVADMFGETIRKKIPPAQLLKNFEYWQKNVRELENSRKSRKANASAADYKRNIERRKRRAEKRAKENAE